LTEGGYRRLLEQQFQRLLAFAVAVVAGRTSRRFQARRGLEFVIHCRHHLNSFPTDTMG
jgi:hypothetical protein